MSRRGVTLIELLIAVVIGSIAMFALAAPLIAEGQFFRKGKRQTEAQRDGQLVLRAMAFVAHESSGYTPTADGVDFLNTSVCGVNPVSFHRHTDVLEMHCGGAPPTILIDGGRSRVAGFTVTPVIANKLVRIRLDITHRLRTTDPFTENELVETELFLRNGT